MSVYSGPMRPPREFNKELVRRYMQWMIIQHYALSTQKDYSQILGGYCAFLRRKMITAATHNDVLEFLASEAAEAKLSKRCTTNWIPCACSMISYESADCKPMHLPV